MCSVEVFHGPQQVLIAASQDELQDRPLLAREQLAEHLETGSAH